MVSTGNKAKLVTSDICMGCAKCCKEFTMTTDINCALRFLWVEERKIKPKDTPFQMPYGGGIERCVKFKYPCTKLECISGVFQCKVWDKQRPDFCNTYPDHIFYDVEVWNTEKIQRLLNYESENCPALNKVSVQDVVNMLNKKREVKPNSSQ